MANEITGNPWNEFSKTRKCLNTVGADRPGFHGDLQLIEIIESPDHPWFVGVQFHPELKSRVVDVHPLFRDFISAAKKYKNDEF